MATWTVRLTFSEEVFEIPTGLVLWILQYWRRRWIVHLMITNNETLLCNGVRETEEKRKGALLRLCLRLLRHSPVEIDDTSSNPRFPSRFVAAFRHKKKKGKEYLRTLAIGDYSIQRSSLLLLIDTRSSAGSTSSSLVLMAPYARRLLYDLLCGLLETTAPLLVIPITSPADRHPATRLGALCCLFEIRWQSQSGALGSRLSALSLPRSKW